MKRGNFLKYLCAFFILAVLFYLVDLCELVESLRHLSLEAVFYLAVLAVVLLYVSALKWSCFLDAFGTPVPVWRLFNLYLVGYFVNLLVPSYFGGDAARSWYLGKSIGQHKAFAATILERFTGLVAMLSLAFVFIWIVEGVTLNIKAAVVFISVGLFVGARLALSRGLLDRLEHFSKLKRMAEHLRKVQKGFTIAGSDKKLIVKTLALSFIFHSLTVINTLAAAYAVGWYNAPLGKLFIVVPLILLIAAIPVAPNSLGLQEGAFFFFLRVAGASPAQALGVALVLRAKAYVLALIGGVIWLRIRNNSDPVSHNSQPAL